uniref:Uncharacterized protein n=1 Tax=Corethron hystrix TaxID=216773 RepID=A0A7S1FSY7_9STRA|mmetsp:Transcript_29236/g.67114  ORF Transcript_29236/g.67114 Transcript_29236/m.67114 type:complete len:733 (+) Transcript_29236:279-2477(+)
MKTAPDVSRRKNNVLVSQKEKTSQKSSLKKRISTRNGKQCGSTVETSTSTTSSSRNCSAISVDKSVISDRENCGACRSNDVILDPSKKISNFVKSNHKTIFNTSSENIFSRNNDLAKHESRTLGRRNLGDGEKPVDVTDWRLAIDNIELWRNVQEIPSDPHETCEGNFSPRRLDSSFDSIDSSIKSDSGTLDTKTLIRTFSGRFQGRSSQSKKKKKINFVPHNLSSIISDDSKSSQKMGSSDSMENNFLTKMKYHFLDSISHLDASDNLVSSDLSDCRGNKLPQINHITSMKRSEKMQRISQPVTSAMERIYSLRFKINSHKNSNNGALHESCDSGSTLISGSTLVSDDSSIVSLRKSAFNMPKRERIGMLTPPWKTIQSELASHISHETSVNTRTNLPVTSSILCHQNNCSLSSSTVSKENRTHGYVYKESEKGNTLYDLSALYRHPITPHSLGSTILNNSDSDANDDSSGEISENQGSTVSSLSMSTKSLALSSVSMSFSLSANDRPSQYLRSTRSATKYSSELDSVIILVMNPRIPNNQRFNKFMEVQKFELLMVSFNNAVAVMRDLLLQVRPSVTDKSLQMQTYVGLCRPIDDRRRGARCTEKMINYFPTESYKIDPGEILIAIPQCLDATMCAELAQPILDDPSVVSIVDQIRNNPTKDPTPITPNEGVCSQPNLLKNSEVSTHSQRTAISSCSSQSLTKKKIFYRKYREYGNTILHNSKTIIWNRK